ncbi:MAG: hypothetical protein AAF530_24370 [Pseudomonadota bacterium]
MRNLCLALTLALTVALVAPTITAMPASAQEVCLPQVNRVLAQLDIDPEETRRISVALKRELTGEGPRSAGIDAWVRLTDCSGALVIEMSENCHLRQLYTRGNCSIPNLPRY